MRQQNFLYPGTEVQYKNKLKGHSHMFDPVALVSALNTVASFTM